MGVVSAQHQEEHTGQVVTSSTTKQANIPLPCNGTSQRALAQSPSHTCQLRALAERARRGGQFFYTETPPKRVWTARSCDISIDAKMQRFGNYGGTFRDLELQLLQASTMFVLDRVQNSELGLRAFAVRALVQVERNRRSGNIIIISGPLWTRQPLST